MPSVAVAERNVLATLARHQLANGLRVLVAPVPEVSAIGITVCYDVGYRTESVSGLAHLFEHLMFTGSANVEASEHTALVRSNGGICNAATHRDHTSYFNVLPPHALELGLFLEADRMRGLRLEQRNLDNQVRVVAEEIRRNVENRPYGGFPWVNLPGTLFDSFANTHNGYGDIASLRAVSLAQCERFFADHYCPANAVVVVAGPVVAEQVFELAERHFGSVPARPATARVQLAEAGPAAGRRLELVGPLVAVPAVAVGWRLAPPGSAEHLAAILLATVLSDGPTSILHRRLVQAGMATHVTAAAALTGRVLESRDAEIFTVHAIHPAGVPAETVVQEILGGLRQVAGGVEPVARDRALRRLEASWYAEVDPIGARSRRIASAELLYGDGELAMQAPQRLALVQPADLGAAASALLGSQPGQLRVLPPPVPQQPVAPTTTGSARAAR